MAGRDMTEELRNDVLVDIPANQARRFGVSGRMLKPSLATVAAAVSQVPRGTVMSITALRQKLADEHGAQTTCPFFTKRALKAIAEDPNATTPYWRIVRANGAMVNYFPGGVDAQANRIKAETRAARVGDKTRQKAPDYRKVSRSTRRSDARAIPK